MAKLRKIFTISVMAITVLSMSVVVAPDVNAAASAGDLIKTDAYSSVYYLGDDGKRYGFPNETTFMSWYSDFSGVMTVPQSELEGYRVAGMITIRPGTNLVKIQSDPRVYAVEPGGSLRWIESEEAALALYGEGWNTMIVDVPDSFIGNYMVNGVAYGDSSDADIEASALDGTEYPAGQLVQWEGESDIYYISTDGEARLIADEAAMAANRFSMDNVITADAAIAMPALGAEITGAEEDLTDTTTGGSSTGITPGAGTGLTVGLSADTPVSATLPQFAANVEFLKFNVSASADGDVEIKNLSVKRIGVGNTADLQAVYIYEGSTRLTNSRTISATTNKVTFNGLDFEIPAGETKTLSVRATTVGNSGNQGFSIDAASDITTNGASVSGSFPISGNLMSLSNVPAGNVTATLQTVANLNLKVGDIQKEVAKLKIQETSSNEDVTVAAIAFTNNGAADFNDLKNFKLYQSTELVASLEASDTDRAVMMLDEPIVVKKGSSKIFTLKADIMGGVSATSIQYEIDDATDVVATGNTYGYNVRVTLAGNVQTINVEAGELTIEIDGPAAYEVTNDVDDAVLANLTITTGGDEEVEVKTLYGYIDGTEADADNNMDTGLENVQLVNVDTGDIYDVTADDAATDNDYFFKITNFTVPAGESNWRIEFDTVSTVIENGDVLKLVMFAGADTTTLGTYPAGATSGAKGVEAENADGKALDDIKPAAQIEGNNVTVEIASLAVAAINLNNGDAVLKESNVELIRMSLEAGAAEDVRVTTIAFEDGSGAAASLVEGSDYTLWLINEDNQLATVLQSGVSNAGGTSVTFSDIEYEGLSGLTIPAGETWKVGVTADVNSATTTANLLQIALSADSILAEDSDGDALYNNNNVGGTDQVTGDNGATADGRLLTINPSGTLTLNADDVSPDKQHILLSGSTGNKIYSFKADANYENIEIKTLKFTNTTPASNDAVASLELWYDADGTGSAASPVKVATKSTFAGNQIVFNDLDSGSTPVVVSKDTDAVLELRLNVGGIGTDATDTATSGDVVAFDLTSIPAGDVEARGQSSNSDLLAAAISTSTNITSLDQTIYSSKVTASKSANQETDLLNDGIDALKITIGSSGNEGDTATLEGMTVNWSCSGGVLAYGFKLKNGQGAYIASTTAGDVAGASGSDALDNFIADNITATGETYTVELFATGAADANDDKCSVWVDVNSNGGLGTDGIAGNADDDEITWNDGADDSGAIDISWIDLGEDSTVTQIKNTLTY